MGCSGQLLEKGMPKARSKLLLGLCHSKAKEGWKKVLDREEHLKDLKADNHRSEMFIPHGICSVLGSPWNNLSHGLVKVTHS